MHTYILKGRGKHHNLHNPLQQGLGTDARQSQSAIDQYFTQLGVCCASTKHINPAYTASSPAGTRHYRCCIELRLIIKSPHRPLLDKLSITPAVRSVQHKMAAAHPASDVTGTARLLAVSFFSGGSRGCPRCPDTVLSIRVPFLKKIYVQNMSLMQLVSMNISRKLECIKPHHFDIRNTTIFWGGSTPLPRPSALDLRCPIQMDWTPDLVKS